MPCTRNRSCARFKKWMINRSGSAITNAIGPTQPPPWSNHMPKVADIQVVSITLEIDGKKALTVRNRSLFFCRKQRRVLVT